MSRGHIIGHVLVLPWERGYVVLEDAWGCILGGESEGRQQEDRLEDREVVSLY